MICTEFGIDVLTILDTEIIVHLVNYEEAKLGSLSLSVVVLEGFLAHFLV